MSEVRILIIDEDEGGRTALGSLLADEGWVIRTASDAHDGLEQVREGPWQLVVVTCTLARPGSVLWEALEALAWPKGPLPVLFLVPVSEIALERTLEERGLRYSHSPIQLNDLLETVSDLLQGTGVIQQPLRRVRVLAAEAAAASQRAAEKEKEKEGSKSKMFASREGYESYTEEELKAFEEEEKQKREQKKSE